MAIMGQSSSDHHALEEAEKNLSGKKENGTSVTGLKIVLTGYLITFLFLVLDPKRPSCL